ncbi:MAG TPA: hypothetical protein VGH64_01285 [Puia sp.]|jgi:hypothetical protein
MRSKIFFTVSAILCAHFCEAQSNHTKINPIEVAAFNRLVDFIKTDTQAAKIAEYEKNNISHQGEENVLSIPIARGVSPEGPESGSWDKFLPTVYHKDATVGSPFLISIYVQGLVVNQLDSVINKPDYQYNYDKITGNLLLKRNNQDPIAVNRDQVNMFCLKLDKGGFIFMRVPIINANEFLQVISKGTKYSSYKLYKNILVKMNQQTTNGYTPDGKNYDEYKDVDTYYMMDETTQEWSAFELSKKSLRKVLADQSAVVEQYMKNHRGEEITDSYVAQLLDKLNN